MSNSKHFSKDVVILELKYNKKYDNTSISKANTFKSISGIQKLDMLKDWIGELEEMYAEEHAKVFPTTNLSK